MNFLVLVFRSTSVCMCVRYTPRSGLVGSCNMHMFPFSTYFHRVFQSAGPIYTPTRIIEGFPLFLIFLLTWYRHCKSFVLPGLMLAISVGVEWCLIVVLICNSLMNDAVKHIFMCLLSIRLCIMSRDLEVNAYHLLRKFQQIHMLTYLNF